MADSSENTTIKTQLDHQQLDRWQVYQRLKQLQIPCRCGCHQPLEVELPTPLKLWQFWNVVRRFSASRETLSNYLEDCWRLPDYQSQID